MIQQNGSSCPTQLLFCKSKTIWFIHRKLGLSRIDYKYWREPLLLAVSCIPRKCHLFHDSTEWVERGRHKTKPFKHFWNLSKMQKYFKDCNQFSGTCCRHGKFQIGTWLFNIKLIEGRVRKTSIFEIAFVQWFYHLHAFLGSYLATIEVNCYFIFFNENILD